MTTSPRNALISNLTTEQQLSLGQKAYFRARLRNNIHEHILNVFCTKAEQGVTKATLAKRLGKRPEQITRWLGAPGNLTIDTVSDLLLAMGCELTPCVDEIKLKSTSNQFHEFATMEKIEEVRSSGYWGYKEFEGQYVVISDGAAQTGSIAGPVFQERKEPEGVD